MELNEYFDLAPYVYIKKGENSSVFVSVIVQTRKKYRFITQFPPTSSMQGKRYWDFYFHHPVDNSTEAEFESFHHTLDLDVNDALVISTWIGNGVELKARRITYLNQADIESDTDVLLKPHLYLSKNGKLNEFAVAVVHKAENSSLCRNQFPSPPRIFVNFEISSQANNQWDFQSCVDSSKPKNIKYLILESMEGATPKGKTKVVYGDADEKPFPQVERDFSNPNLLFSSNSGFHSNCVECP